MKTRMPLAALFVLLIGSLQIAGYVFNIDALRKAGQLSAASPLPLVFSHFRGLETFSPKFDVVIASESDQTQVIRMTPRTYSSLPGPYNRRNVYGAAFAFGAVLNQPNERTLVNGVLRYGLCPGGPLRSIIEQQYQVARGSKISVRITPKGGSARELAVECGT